MTPDIVSISLGALAGIVATYAALRSTGRERGAELEVRPHFSAIAVAHIERVAPES